MNSVIVTNLSELDITEKEVFQVAWEKLKKPLVKNLIEYHFCRIVQHYLESKKMSKKEGAIWISPPSGEDDYITPNYGQIPFSPIHVSFRPFDNLLVDCNPFRQRQTEGLVSALYKFTTPEKMPVYFLDSVGVSYYCAEIGKQVTVDAFLALILPDYNISKFTEPPESVKQPKPRQQLEQKLEDQLYDWLRIKGVEVERQVATSKHRLDLWIPNKAMLELKQGRVSGDDVCQAIDYAATYQMPIVLVGTGLSSAASRGIDGFNRAIGKDLVIFVTWGGIKPYLSGVL